MPLKKKDKAKLKTIALHFPIGLAAAFALPVFSRFAPATEKELLTLLSLLLVNTALSLAGGLIFGFKHGFSWLYLPMAAVVFLAYVLVCFPSPAGLFYLTAYVALAALGMLVAVQSDRLSRRRRNSSLKR